MSLIKQLLGIQRKFTPASTEVNWTRIETLVHGPGAGDIDRDINSAVFACLQVLASAYPEPPLVVRRRSRDGDVQNIPEHPLQLLLAHPTPNGELTVEELLYWTAWSKHTDGNAYWLKVRSGDERTGNVVELWPVSPRLMAPVTEDGDWISYYSYQSKPNVFTRIPLQNVVHFRLGVDDTDMRKGMSPLKALARQVATDDEADKFIESLLKNYAVPGLVVIPTGGVSLQEADADAITSRLRRKFGGDNRGNIAVLSRETKVEQFGFSPKDLDMSVLHRIPEERISAALGVPAIVAGLGAGLDRATYANFREAREMFTEGKLIPLWRTDAAKLNASLVPDFADQRSGIYVEHELSEVRALQEDQNGRYARLQIAVGKPFMTRNEAREDIGLDHLDDWDAEDIDPPAPQPPQLVAEVPEEEPIKTDLRRWQRKSTKSVERGSGSAVDFESAHIPPTLHAAICGQLEEAKTQGDVTNIFENAVLWGAYP